MKTLKIKITLTEMGLGMMPTDPEIVRKHLASKAPDAKTLEEEVAAVGVEEAMDAQKTVFPRNKAGEPYAYDYQLN